MDKKIILMVILFFLLAIVITKLYMVNGVDWDFIAHYLSAKSADSSNFVTILRNAVATGRTYMNFGIVETKSSYFESYRAPLSIAIFMILYPILGNYSIIAYLIIMVLLLFYATIYFSKKFKINYIVAGALIVLPYIVIFPFIVNSEEMLSLSLMIIALSLEADNKWQSGIVFGLACLAKYTTLIFLPIILLLNGRKNIFKGYVSFVFVTLPWLIFNYLVYGNPIYSYLSSINVSLESSAPSAISITALFNILINFLPAFLIIGVFIYFDIRKNDFKITKKIKKNFLIDKKTWLLLLFFVFSCIEFIILGLHEDVFDQTRYAYFLYASLGFLIGYIITKIIELSIKNNRTMQYKIISKSDIVLFSFSVISMLGTFYFLSINSNSGIYLGSGNPVFNTVVIDLKNINLYNCSFVSNDWVYLRYYNITAFSPYYYNSSIKNYPSIVLNQIGTAPNGVYINPNENVYKNANFNIYFNKTLKC